MPYLIFQLCRMRLGRKVRKFMGRERKDFKRKSGLRDATLFVIATEGEKTEPHYFTQLLHKDYFFSTRVHIEIIPTQAGKSSPRSVITRLDTFKKNYKLRKGDQLWMIIDRDQQTWELAELSEVQKLCKQKKYYLGLTNPAFELWLLLHIDDVNTYTDKELLQIKQNKKQRNRSFCESKLLKLLGSYNKKKPDLSEVIPHVKLAIVRNKILTKNGAIDLFSNIGTNIDELVARLINLASSDDL